jgi:ribose-phosphate pyrophosphokinase
VGVLAEFAATKKLKISTRSLIDEMMSKEPCIFALQASREFGERVAKRLGLSLSLHEERDFEDGEHKTRPLVNVRERDVFVIHSLYSDRSATVNDKLCRLLFFIGALRDASAARITAVIPYLCYARKERKTQSRDPVTTRYLASMLEAVGTERVLTLEVHNVAAFQNAFRCRTDHLEAKKLFANYFAASLEEQEMIVVSPDIGGVKRAEQFRTMLSQRARRDIPMAFMEKHRRGGVVSGEAVVGEVPGKVAIIIDDLVSTGTTLRRTAEACLHLGATKVIAAASHGVFTQQANDTLRSEALEQVIVTDTIPPFRLQPNLVRDKLVVLQAAPLFADAIQRIHDGGSIVDLLELS